ncbi:MAG: hypothetical protein IT384_27955 [Deltaproteobacteria bacterium]|nr:hypothetical protein [Deltaproteobacteria bacterium]
MGTAAGPRSIGAGAALISSILTPACQVTDSLLPPPARPDGAVVFAIGSDEGLIEVIAFDATDPEPPLPIFTHRGTTVLRAAYFDCPLDVLGLERGRQTVNESEGPLELPPAREVQSSLLDASGQSPWVAGDPTALNRILQRLPLPASHLCRSSNGRFSQTSVPISSDSEWSDFALKLDERRVLIGTRDARFFLFELDRASRELDLEFRTESGTATTAPHSAAFVDAAGRIWLFGADGRVARSDALDQPFTILPVRGPLEARTVAAEDESRDAALLVAGYTYRFQAFASFGDIDLFPVYDGVVGSTRSIDRLGEGRFTHIATPHLEFLPVAPTAAPLGQSGIAFSGLSVGSLLVVRDGGATEVPWPTSNLEEDLREDPTLLTLAPSGDVYAGTRVSHKSRCKPETPLGCFEATGRVWRWRISGEWKLLDGADLIGPTDLVVPFEDRVVLYGFALPPVGRRTALKLWSPRVPSCTDEEADKTDSCCSFQVPGAVEAAIRLEGERAFFLWRRGHLAGEPGLSATVLKREARTPSCLVPPE